MAKRRYILELTESQFNTIYKALHNMQNDYEGDESPAQHKIGINAKKVRDSIVEQIKNGMKTVK